MLNDYNEDKKRFGYIYLWRALTEWEWYTDINVKVLFIHLLLKANHKDKTWRGIEIKRGSFLTSREVLAFETGLSEMQVRTALKKLKNTNEIEIKTTSQYSIITVNNYELYQNNNQQNNQQVTNEYPTNNQQVTTTNNDKEMNNNVNNIINRETKNNKNFIIPSLEEIKNYCIERKNNINADHFYDYYSSKGWMIGKNKMKDWKAAVRNWERNKFSTNPITEKQQVDEEYNFGIG